MTEIIQSPPRLPSPSSSITCVPPTDNDGLHQQANVSHDTLINSPPSCPVSVQRENTESSAGGSRRERKRRQREEDQLSLLTVLGSVFRNSLVACRSASVEELSSSSAMEIGWPTNVRHVAHVTFDRFDGFLGLPVEFEPEVSRRPPSASTSVFGVSTESMQLSFDSRGNSVPTILLMMQRHLYAQGGLQAEGIFRINAENDQEEYVREELNRGVVPDEIDVHCLAGLIKAWFRELPSGLLDSLSSEQVMQAQTEEECAQLVRVLPASKAALLDWAINLMADVAQLEHLNKMNARNIAMVFAPNMTQMADPLTALMYAVQVMNFLKTLIVKTLREREDSMVDLGPPFFSEPSDDNENYSSLQPIIKRANEVNEEGQVSAAKEPLSRSHSYPTLDNSKTERENHGFLTSIENLIPDGKGHLAENCQGEVPKDVAKSGSGRVASNVAGQGAQSKYRRTKSGQSINSNSKNASKKVECPVVHVEKGKEASIFSHLNSRTELVETWR